ncbi:MAG: universal stress protein [Salinibacter sp.]|uniref:universal stress protein n=1 Tax=Salinibacter sp. TaxID=2065818 RepID=UPI0035D4F82D
MLDLDTILFPTDFSSVAEDAFAHAAHLALQSGATIHVFNVVTPGDDDASNPMDFLPVAPVEGEAVGDAPPQRMEVQTVTQEQGTVPVVYAQTDSTSPERAIVDHATEHDVDLVLMGTHGRKGVDRLLSGSVAEEVVRQAPCPVFTVPAYDEGQLESQIARILVPVDLSEQSTLVADHAAGLSEVYNAPVDLLHVVEEAAFPAAYGVDPLVSSRPDVQERAREALEALAEQMDGLSESVNVHLLAGYAARDIVDFAVQQESDLIVMATHGRTGLQRFLIGSVAEKVVRRAPCPVFTVKSFGKSLVPVSADGSDQ